MDLASDRTGFPRLDLTGRTALITGSAGGLGFAMAKAFAQCGARIAINDIDQSRAEAAAERLGHGAIAVAGDVSAEASAEAIVQHTTERLGSLDILVNNAAVAEAFAATIKQEVESWQRVIDVNLKGCYLMARAAARVMIPAKRGAIVNLSSITGLAGFPASNGYGVSKAAIVMLTKTLATEFARHDIRVNAVAPGFVVTPMTEQMPQEFIDMNVRRMPLGRSGEPDEIARAVVFLASPWASFITGVTLPVDGGWAAYGAVGDASRPRNG